MGYNSSFTSQLHWQFSWITVKIRTWVSNYKQYFHMDEIIYPHPQLNIGLVDLCVSRIYWNIITGLGDNLAPKNVEPHCLSRWFLRHFCVKGSNCKRNLGPHLLTWINLDHSKDKWSHILWGVGWITYPFPKFNSATVEISKWISNSFPHYTGIWLLFHAEIWINPC